MRRLATTLGILGATLTLAVALPASAQAATGDLSLNGEHFTNPSGCLKIADNGNPIAVIRNYTDAGVIAFSGEDCTGSIVKLVNPGATEPLVGAKSVYVPE
ncbi:hypothetical protein ACFWNG_05570 [Streptomyces sp. NPDC058391]|uniref:hypothetical protein n=1 Tax=Streptomyces sp. NPDC058391 TaxID=3346476 RepID=UPI0036544CCF